MGKQESQRLRDLAQSVGQFIRYWGFRNVHGEIWTVLFLAKAPMAAVDIQGALGRSKALVSPALRELSLEGLIVPAASENSKVKRFAAVEDVAGVIRAVLRRREMDLLAQAGQAHRELSKVSVTRSASDPRRLERVGAMIAMADQALRAMVNQDEFWTA